jgi:hypothetical protein
MQWAAYALLLSLPVLLGQFVVVSMSDDVFDVHPIVAELDEGNHPKVVAANVDHPPLIPVLKVT